MGSDGPPGSRAPGSSASTGGDGERISMPSYGQGLQPSTLRPASAEVWAVEVLEALGWKGNAETLALAAADWQQHQRDAQATVNVKLINITTLVPCSMGSSLPVSKVDKPAIKSHEIRVFKDIVAPLLRTAAAKKLNPRYVPVRNDLREDGILELAKKMKPSRIYIPTKQSSKLVEKLVEAMPVGCTVVGVVRGRKVQELTALAVEVFDSVASVEDSGEGSSGGDGLSRTTSIDYYDNVQETNLITYSGEEASGPSRALSYASPCGSFQERACSPSPAMPLRSQSCSASAFSRPSSGGGLSPFNTLTILEGCDEVQSVSMQFPISGSSPLGTSFEVTIENRSAAQSPAPRLTPKHYSTRGSSPATPNTPRTKSLCFESTDTSSSVTPTATSPQKPVSRAVSKEDSPDRKGKGLRSILGMRLPFAGLSKTGSRSRSWGIDDGKANDGIVAGGSKASEPAPAASIAPRSVDDAVPLSYARISLQGGSPTRRPPNLSAANSFSLGNIPLQP